MKEIKIISVSLLVFLLFVTGCQTLAEMDELADTNRGRRQWERGNYKDAISDFEHALKRNPQSAEAYLGLALIWEDLGDYEKAKEYFSKAVQIEPRTRFNLYDIGSNKVESADIRRAWRERSREHYEEAIASFNLALQKNPQSAEAYNGLATLCEDTGDYNKAIEYFSKAIEIEPRAKYRAGYFFLRALMRMKKKNFEIAIQDYTSAIQTDPVLIAAYIDRAYCYREIRKLEAAVADYDEVLKLTPDDKRAYKTRKEVLAEIGKSTL